MPFFFYVKMGSVWGISICKVAGNLFNSIYFVKSISMGGDC